MTYKIISEKQTILRICFPKLGGGYDGKPSIFDAITKDDLIIAFFPCIHFCDAKTLMFRGVHITQKGKPLREIMKRNIELNMNRTYFFETLLMLVCLCDCRGIRLIIENPWNTSRATYLQNNFIEPTIIDNNRALRGDYYVKPTAYWFIGCIPTNGYSPQPNLNPKIVYKQRGKNSKVGVCDEERSMISPDYARNFICDFILGKVQQNTIPELPFID